MIILTLLLKTWRAKLNQINHTTFLDRPSQETFFMSPTVKAEIEKRILSLESKKSNSIYGVSVDLLKVLAKHVYQILNNLFNESMSTGVFPDHM